MDYLKNKTLLFLAKIFFSVAILYFIFLRISFLAILKIIQSIDFVYIIGILVLYLFSIAIAVYKWNLLLKDDFWKVLKVYLVSLYYSLLLPGQIAGEGVKIYKLGKIHSNYSAIGAGVVFDKITGFVAVIFLALLGFFLSSEGKLGVGNYFLLVLALIFFLVILSMMLFNFFVSSVEKFIKNSKFKYIKNLESVSNSFSYYQSNKILILQNLGLGLVMQISLIILNLFLGKSLSINLNFWDWSWIYGVVSLALFLPLTIAGLGVREGAFIGLMSIYHVSIESAVLFSLSIFLIQLFGVFLGFILDWIEK